MDQTIRWSVCSSDIRWAINQKLGPIAKTLLALSTTHKDTTHTVAKIQLTPRTFVALSIPVVAYLVDILCGGRIPEMCLLVAAQFGPLEFLKKYTKWASHNIKAQMLARAAVGGDLARYRYTNYYRQDLHNLPVAAKYGHDEILKYGLKRGRNVSLQLINQCLRTAVQYGHASTAALCVRHGANELYLAANIAVASGNLECVKYCVKLWLSADPNRSRQYDLVFSEPLEYRRAITFWITDARTNDRSDIVTWLEKKARCYH